MMIPWDTSDWVWQAMGIYQRSVQFHYDEWQVFARSTVNLVTLLKCHSKSKNTWNETDNIMDEKELLPRDLWSSELRWRYTLLKEDVYFDGSNQNKTLFFRNEIHSKVDAPGYFLQYSKMRMVAFTHENLFFVDSMRSIIPTVQRTPKPISHSNSMAEQQHSMPYRCKHQDSQR